MIAYNYIIL